MKQLANVRHDYVRYANCWEDADVLLKGLDIQPGEKVLTIGSAGDNSFSLLLNDPEFVLAVDLNQAQLRLIELKKAAFISLNYEEFLSFLGFEEATNRIELYKKVCKELSLENVDYWDTYLSDLKKGIIYSGKFERYFKVFRTKILPIIHSKSTVKELFSTKNEDEQIRFYETRWNNLRWRLLFKLFFSKRVMGILGRDPAFLKEVEIPVSTFILNQAKNHLSSTRCQKNYFLHFIMKGNFGDYLPHYARKENFSKIKQNVHKLKTFHGIAEDAFKEYSGFSKFNLSNIFEYMDPELFKNVSKNFVEQSSNASRFVYWNLMVPRKMFEVSELLKNDSLSTAELRKLDNGFFYSGVFIDFKK